MSVKPQLQALLLAEKIYETKDGKKIIAGTFNRVLFDPKPAQQIESSQGEKQSIVQGGTNAGSPYAYMSLTDVCDGTEIHFQFVSLSNNKTLFGTAIKIAKAERPETVELIVPLPDFQMREKGIYAFEVLWEGEILGSYRITAESIRD